jgi:hypothetical protein
MLVDDYDKREVLDTLHRIAIALESISRQMHQLNEMLRAVDIPSNQDS